MKRLFYECRRCGEKSPFEKSDLPAGFLSPEDLDENKIKVLEIECPNCKEPGRYTREEVIKALESPAKGMIKFFWEGEDIPKRNPLYEP